MNLYNRIDKITSFLANANEEAIIDSKKKLHKLIYLLQINGEDFDQDYIFHYYGVFSPSLAQDLDIAQSEGLVNIKESDDNLGYSIELVEKAQSDLNLLTAKSKKLLRALSREEPQLLEVLSTIVYCSKNFYEGQDLVFKLHELKPKLKKHYNDAFELAEKHFNIKL